MLGREKEGKRKRKGKVKGKGRTKGREGKKGREGVQNPKDDISRAQPIPKDTYVYHEVYVCN